MKLRFEIEVDSEKNTPAHEELEADGSVTEFAVGCVRLISQIYSRVARHNKTAAENFRAMVLVALLHEDPSVFEVDACDVGNISDIPKGQEGVTP